MIIVKQQENFVEIKFHTFSGGEEHVNVVLPSPAIVSSSVEILARIDSSSELMRLLLVTDALKRLGIKTIELVLPYIPYARQDRVCNLGDSFSLKIFANLINAQGYSRVHVTDGVYKLVDQVSVDQERHGCLETVFKDSQLVKTTTLAEIRAITDRV